MILCNKMAYCYMKKKIFKGAQKISEEKSYVPDESLVLFVQNWLRMHKKREEVTKEGKELSSNEKQDIRNLDKAKVDILDNVIFPSFANLIYFFEAVAGSNRMFNAFQDELEELLDPRKAKSAAEISGHEMRMSSMQFRRNNLARLVDSALAIPIRNYSNRQAVDDFRIGLMYQLFKIIGDYMDLLLSHEYSTSQIWLSFIDDYKKMQGWLALLSRSVKESPKEFDRKMGFEPIWFSNRSPDGGWNF